MNHSPTLNKIDWNPILNRMSVADGQSLPIYPGDLKTALLRHAGLTQHPQGEELYQLAQQIAQLTTYSDSEIVYWFSRLASLINESPNLPDHNTCERKH